ncbi:hypothetical protein HOD75_01460 [archaeon]|nr:hypothetical protein [archaeon]MBT4241545.1 hypothetical protein [archaeon]MBT4417583.1 hypothetical protein [archaeon]
MAEDYIGDAGDIDPLESFKDAHAYQSSEWDFEAREKMGDIPLANVGAKLTRRFPK